MKVEEEERKALAKSTTAVSTAEAAKSAEKATAETNAKDNAKRQQVYISSGVDAADSLSNLSRVIDLLDNVDTGGIDQAIIKGKQLFGVESADEGELSARLGKSVLAQLKPIFGSAFTAQEGQRLEGIEARLGANAKTNRRLIKDAYKVAERSARRGLAAAKKSGDEFAIQEIQSALDALKEASKKVDAKNYGGNDKNQNPASKTLPMTNSQGWGLMTDANGNQAYVSPDGNSFEEVK